MLHKEAMKKRNDDALQLYLKCMKKIETINDDIITNMAKGFTSYSIFYEKSPLLDYSKFFEHFSHAPYTKSVMQTLREMYPEFYCYNEHIHYSTHDFIDPDSPDINFYRVGVSWKEENECKCVLF